MESKPAASFVIPRFLLPLFFDHLERDVSTLKELRRVCKTWRDHADQIVFRRIGMTYHTTDQFIAWAQKPTFLSNNQQQHATDSTNASSIDHLSPRTELQFVHYVQFFVSLDTRRPVSSLGRSRFSSWSTKLNTIMAMLPNIKGVLCTTEHPRSHNDGFSNALLTNRSNLTHLDLFPYACKPYEYPRRRKTDDNWFPTTLDSTTSLLLATEMLSPGPLKNIKVVNIDLSWVVIEQFNWASLGNLVNVTTMVVNSPSYNEDDDDVWVFPRLLTHLPDSVQRLKLITDVGQFIGWSGREFIDGTSIKKLVNLHALELEVSFYSDYEKGLRASEIVEFERGVVTMFNWFMPNLQTICCPHGDRLPTTTYTFPQDKPPSDTFFNVIARTVSWVHFGEAYEDIEYPPLNPDFYTALEGLQFSYYNVTLFNNNLEGVTIEETFVIPVTWGLAPPLSSWVDQIQSLALSPHLHESVWEEYEDQLLVLLSNCKNITHITIHVDFRESNLVSRILRLVHEHCRCLYSLVLHVLGFVLHPRIIDEMMSEVVEGLPNTLRVLCVKGVGSDVGVEWVKAADKRGIRRERIGGEVFGEVRYPASVLEM
ncbi:hypothetical protein HDU76_002812 [Blyttiomyces sp. JEL0837]|nr:hypothetical protein HDU76_002812 [Blyttiomyces sp. JEL0837]